MSTIIAVSCDVCGKTINAVADAYLISARVPQPWRVNAEIFYRSCTCSADKIGQPHAGKDFCSWRCLFKWIRQQVKESDDVIILPHLNPQVFTKGVTVADFFSALQEVGNEVEAATQHTRALDLAAGEAAAG